MICKIYLIKFEETFPNPEGFFMPKKMLLCEYELENVHKRLSVVFTD